MKLFKEPKAILSEILQMESAEKNRREDRALVSSFFNGAPPLSDEEAEELGFTVNVNHLFGYTDLSNAADQMFSTFTKPSHLFTVEMRNAPPGKSVEWSMKAQESASRVLRKIRAFKPAMQGVTGDATMHGEAVFHFVNRTFPLPKQAPLSKFLVPADASIDPAELTHFAREGEIGLLKLHRIARTKPEGWNMGNVNRVLAKLYGKSTDAEGGGMSDNTLDTNNLEELEYVRQQNSATDTKRKTSWKVYYFYQKRCDVRNEPYACTILLKDTEDDTRQDPKDTVLYESDECYAAIGNIIHPIFMDCIIGGEMKWHRVLGLGTLNYALNQSIETLICRAQQSTFEGSMNLWQASDSVGRDEMQQILLKHNGIIPQGMELVPNRFQTDIRGIFDNIQFLRQQGSKNARGVTPNNGDQNNQLEVQAEFEMNQSASISGNRSSNFYDYLDPMWQEVWARLTCPCIESEDDGYSAIMDFQGEMESEDIPLYYLQPHNVHIAASRLVGDGLRSKELGIAQFLTANRQMFVPEVQPRITRLVTAIAFDNYRLAEEFTPIQEVPDDPQNMRAQAENSAMLTQRAPQTPKADDIDALHVGQHFPAMEILISDALQYQQAAFTPQQAQSFQIIGKHIALHIQRIEAQAMNVKNDANREMARHFMEQLTQVAAMGDKLLKNMQQMQDAGSQKTEMDPTEMAKLQLEVEKLQFNRQKLAVNSQFKDRQLSAREQQQAFEQQMRLGENWRNDRAHRQQLAMNDVTTALQVSDATSKSGAET
jgi:hypothetical protein